jgi:hypothetical protein
MTIRTAKLINDIKNEFGIVIETEIELPEKPKIPEREYGDGDNSDSAYFEYSEEDGKLMIVALTAEGKARTSLVVPYSHNGKVISLFADDVFAGNTKIKEVRILSDCFELKTIILENTDPNKIAVGRDLLKNVGECYIYVPKASYSAYLNHYFWGAYAGKLKQNG